jgi:hypothetical protein
MLFDASCTVHGRAECGRRSSLYPFRPRRPQLQTMLCLRCILLETMLGRSSGATFTPFLLSWLNRFLSVSFPQAFVRFVRLFNLAFQAGLQTVSSNPIADRQRGRRERADGSLCPSRASTSMTHFQRNCTHLSDHLG